MFYFITKLVLLLLLRRGGCGNYCGCLQLLPQEKRRHTFLIGVSVGVPGRRVLGPIFAIYVSYMAEQPMVVRQHPVQFAGLVENHFSFLDLFHFLDGFIFWYLLRRGQGLWQLLRVLTVFTSEERRHTHMGQRCVDKCSRSKNTRPNSCS
jgi:hypothetical protein